MIRFYFKRQNKYQIEIAPQFVFEQLFSHLHTLDANDLMILCHCLVCSEFRIPNSHFHIFTIPIWNMIRANAFQNTNTQYTCRIWHDCHFQHENRLFTEWSTLKLEFQFHLKKMLLVSGLMWLNSMCVRYTTS